MLNIITQIATAYNTLNATLMEPYIADDFIYESQHVFEPMVGKDNFLEYITSKFETIKRTDNIVYAELGYCNSSEINCIIMAQGDKENKGALLFPEINDNGLIKRMDMCTVAPNWRDAKRTNEYPGL